MEEIAAAAGITKLIVYRHFTGKEALYRAVLQGAFVQLAKAPRGAPEAGVYGVGARALLEIARADESGFRLLWRHASREPRFARYADELRRRAVADVRTGLADRVPAARIEWAAHAVVGYLVEAVLNWLEFGDRAHDEQFVLATNQAMRAGVRAWARLAGATRERVSGGSARRHGPRTPGHTQRLPAVRSRRSRRSVGYRS